MQVTSLAWNFAKAHSNFRIASVFRGIVCKDFDAAVRIATNFRCLVLAILLALVGVANSAEAFTYQLDREQQKSSAENEASEQKAADKKYHQLIQQLGDSDFHERQNAESKLTTAGHDALDALIKAKANSSYEQRLRIDRLVAKIIADGRSKELDNFLDGQLELPGWKLFSELMGDNESNRHLFIDLYRQQTSLLEKIEKGNIDTRTFYNEITYAINSPNNADAASKLACFSLYVAAHSTALAAKAANSEADLTITKIYSNYGQSRSFEGPYQAFHQAALEKWVSVESENRLQQNQKLTIAMRMNRKSGLPAARKVLRRKNEYSSSHLLDAFEMVARYGGPEDIQAIATQIENPRLVHHGIYVDSNNNRKSLKISIGDVALATSIRLAEHDLSEFGFVETANVFRSNYLTPRNVHGFLTKSDREAALEKWDEYQANVGNAPQTDKSNLESKTPPGKPSVPNQDAPTQRSNKRGNLK